MQQSSNFQQHKQKLCYGAISFCNSLCSNSFTHIDRANHGRRGMASESKGSEKRRRQILLNLSGREEFRQQTDTALRATCEQAIHQRLPATTADFHQCAECLCLKKNDTFTTFTNPLHRCGQCVSLGFSSINIGYLSTVWK